MPIQLNCPNGHHLTAKESNAGKTGRCPACQAPVTIPTLNETVITDSAIINILGTPTSPKNQKVGTTIAPKKKSSAASSQPHRTDASSATLPHVKICPNCEREIDLGYHICPHCHTYITGLNDF